eukprot:gnl/MRDRNA2_/MRDRNA2_85598_c0_seq1.p1 gnl/MRDRNA2_/MRDRNA2_85598_c0~~gnl/MRDRNA2_/MRDRNA2_85598_c0_seq1.p1  ORF type:complete len:518 (+),score=109.85 gnl/MRDRNA2_/MRDRNA2_85598_c0_seq1:86-1639(+)
MMQTRNGARQNARSQNRWCDVEDSQYMCPGQMQWESPVKVAPKVAMSGTPTVVPPPVWVGMVGRGPIPMNANQQQAMAYMPNPSGGFHNDAGYPGMTNVNQFTQQNQQSPQHLQPQQSFWNQSNGGQGQQWGCSQDPHGIFDQANRPSASQRRRNRRRAQRSAHAGDNAGPVSPDRPFVNTTMTGNGIQNNGYRGNEMEPQDIPDGELLVGDPHILALNHDLANEATELLESGTREQKGELLQWLMPATLDLAMSAPGCRVVQAAVEVAGGEHRSLMTKYMHGHVAELLDSPHGNHVLQKCIEVLPPDIVQFILEELSAFSDPGLSIARHRFGCRILERLLEHCPAEQTRDLAEGVIENAYVLCRHPFGNYVVQHVLEYGTLHQKNSVVEQLLQGGVMQLAMHRVASNVIERALVECTAEGRRALVEQLVVEPSATLAMASSRYGSFIAQRLLEAPPSPQRDELWQQLSEGLEILKASKHGQQLCKTIAPEEAETASGTATPENTSFNAWAQEGDDF